jgi:hypothetical protein
MNRVLKLTLASLSLAIVAGAPALAAGKAEVDAAIAQCAVGETISGYLAVVAGKEVSADVRAAMEEINIRRRAVYAELARRQNVQIDVVARLTGEKQIGAAAPGACVFDDAGAWRQIGG